MSMCFAFPIDVVWPFGINGTHIIRELGGEPGHAATRRACEPVGVVNSIGNTAFLDYRTNRLVTIRSCGYRVNCVLTFLVFLRVPACGNLRVLVFCRQLPRPIKRIRLEKRRPSIADRF